MNKKIRIMKNLIILIGIILLSGCTVEQAILSNAKVLEVGTLDIEGKEVKMVLAEQEIIETDWWGDSIVYYDTIARVLVPTKDLKVGETFYFVEIVKVKKRFIKNK